MNVHSAARTYFLAMRLVRVHAEVERHTFGLLSDQTVIYGDLVEPTGEQWDADV